MTAPSIPGNHPFPQTQKAYAELDESEKKDLFGWTFNHQPEVIHALQHVAGLERGGNRPKFIAGRPAHLTARLDAALLDPKNSEVFDWIATEFVKGGLPQWSEPFNNLLLETAPDYTRIQDFLAQAAAGGGMGAFFAAVSRERRRLDVIKPLAGPLAGLDRSLRELREQATVLEAAAEVLRAAQPVEVEKLQNLLAGASELAEAVRATLARAAETVSAPIPEWDTPEELDARIAQLARPCEELENHVGRRQEFFAGLAGLVQRLEIRSLSPRMEKTLLMIWTDAVAELSAAAESAQPAAIRGPDEPGQWLEWTLTLDDPAKLDLLAELKAAHYESLAELTGELLPAWLPAGDAPASSDDPETPVLEESTLGVVEARPDLAFAPLEPAAPTLDPDPAANRDPDLALSPATSADAPPPVASANPPAVAPEPLVPPAAVEPLPSAKTPEVPTTESPRAGKTAHELDGRAAERILAGVEDGSVAEFARQAELAPEPERNAALASLVYALVADGRFGLAYHLIRATGADRSVNALPPSWIVEALALTQRDSFAQVDVLQRLQEIFGTYDPVITFEESRPLANTRNRLLLVAACLRAALLAPISGADRILANLHFGGEFPELHTILGSAAAFASHRFALSPDALNASLTQADWQEKVAAFRREARQWWERALRQSTNYAPATQIWQHWFKPGMLIWNLVHPLIEGGEAADVREAVVTLDINKAIDDTQRKELGRSQPLVGLARRMLVRWVEEQVIELTTRWSELQVANPAGTASYIREHIDEVRLIFARSGSAAIRRLGEYVADRANAAACRISARVAEAAVRDVSNILSGKVPLPVKPDGWDLGTCLGAELLRVPGVSLDSGWLPSAPDASHTVSAVVDWLARGGDQQDDGRAFEALVASGDHRATRRLLSLLRLEGVSAADIEPLERRREESLGEHRRALGERLVHARSEISEALAKGNLTETEYGEYSSQLDRLEARLTPRGAPAYETFHKARVQVDELEQKLKQKGERSVDEVRRRVDELSVDGAVRQRILTALDSGDVHLANDFLERIRSGEELPTTAPAREESLFLKLFTEKPEAETLDGGSTAAQLYQWLAAGDDLRVVREVHDGRSFGGLDLSRVPGSQNLEYARALQTWFGLKRERRIVQPGDLDGILRALGFSVLRSRLEVRGDRTWAHVETETVTGSPVARYGSEAKGRYRILCDFKRLNEEDLLAAFDSAPREQVADLVFFFGRMSDKTRRSLAALCRRQKRAVIVLDDLILTALASVRGSRLTALLELTLPFTAVAPYSTTASLLPPEMFYGRRGEIHALETITSDGSCLLYGGRQIGKTVLLLHVEHRVHQLAAGSIAKYLDLKYLGVGVACPLDDLWLLLAQNLNKVQPGIFAEPLPPTVKWDWFEGHVSRWLSTDQKRRILLLLDEADTFLEADGRGDDKAEAFYRCAQIKGLMEATGRRFKVVFAGLHNVQRSTRVANNPLAHFGSPVCVGPLLQNGEAREAQALIERPLASLGFFFESKDLVVRMLAQTNYYPNLIQIYCHNLLDHLRKRHHPGTSSRTPPCFVTSQDVEEVYKGQELRKELRHKFQLTLDLDLRFKFIAHLLAFNQVGRGSDEGLSVEEIRQQSLDMWARGFQDAARGDQETARSIPHEAFANLLDEMVGLGILRCTVEGGRYQLRSPNVVALLGTADEVFAVLEGASTWELPVQYAPETFRSLLDSEDKTRRSPLTALQEALLRRNESAVVLLAGSQAAALDDVTRALRHSFGADYFVTLSDVPDLGDFNQQLDKLTARGREGKTAVLVTAEAPWDERWVAEAESRLRRYRLQEARVGIVFLAGPRQLWEQWTLWENWSEVHKLALGPWNDDAVRQWMADANLGQQDRDMRSHIRAVSGYWPFLLYRISSEAASETIDLDVLSRVDAWARSPDGARLGRETFGLETVEATAVLQEMGAFNAPIQLSELQELSAHSAGLVAKLVGWADALNLISRTESGWQLDRAVRTALG